MSESMTDRPPGLRDWKIDHSFDDTEVHIRPRNDLRFHLMDVDCFCSPEIMPRMPGDERDLVVHRPQDGREPAKVKPL